MVALVILVSCILGNDVMTGSLSTTIVAIGMTVCIYGLLWVYGCFCNLTRAIGLNSYFVHGETHMASDGYTNHGWAVIIIDGMEYVFDPEVDDMIAKGGKTRYY